MSRHFAEMFPDHEGTATREQTAIRFDGQQTSTKQSFRDQCNVNCIIAKYKATGQVTHVRNVSGVYRDVVAVPDFQESMNIVAAGLQSCEALPADLRKRFHNDPAEFLEFVHDDRNVDEAIKLGLCEPKPFVQPEAAPDKAPEGSSSEA